MGNYTLPNKIRPVKEFTNIIEKNLRQAQISKMLPALLYSSLVLDLPFYLTDSGFVVRKGDYNKIVNKAIYIIQNN